MKHSGYGEQALDEDESMGNPEPLSLAFVGRRMREALPHLGLLPDTATCGSDKGILSLDGVDVFMQVLPHDVHVSQTTVALVALVPLMNARDPHYALYALRSNIYMQLMHGCSAGADVNGAIFLLTPLDLALIDDMALAAMLRRMSRLARSLCDDSVRQGREAFA